MGIQPDEDEEFDLAGGQGAVHFSIKGDPSNPNVVYVGGDRQPGRFSGGVEVGGFPNSIGANNYSGRLFRVDRTLASGSQAIALTNLPTTTNNSSPHADSRDITFNANGQLIEVDDGGIYMRSNPAGTGVWTSLNGNLQVSEMHSVAYDRVSNVIFGGTQDTGNIEQSAAGSRTWRTSAQGDGGKVAVYVDPHTVNPSISVRYTSYVNLRNFVRRTVDTANNVVSSSNPTMNIVSGAGMGQTVLAYDPEQFYNPIAVNRINGRLYVGNRYIFESQDGGNTFTNLASTGGRSITCFDAGGVRGGVENGDVLYVGAGNAVFRRTASGGAVTQATGYTFSSVQDLVMDPTDWTRVFVADPDQVFRSADMGNSFADISGNLLGKNLHTLAYAQLGALGVILAGADDGVFYSTSDNWLGWNELGAGTLPNAPVEDLVYDPVDDVLVASELGRGAWTISNFSTAIGVPEPGSLAVVGLGMCALLRRRGRVNDKVTR